MRNQKTKKFILAAVIFTILLSFSIVLAAQSKDITWFSIFGSNSYKIRLDGDIKKLEKTKDTIFLSIDNLKAMLAQKYGTPEVYIEFSDEKFNPDEKDRISLPISEENTYSLGRLFYTEGRGWTVNNIVLAIDDRKYLSINDAKEYQSSMQNITADYHSRLVNRDNMLPDAFNNENLVTIKGVQAVIGSKDMKLDMATLQALKAMLDKANIDGVKGFILNSTYRSYKEQKNLFDYRYNERKASGAADPYEEAAKIVAYPGTSEHQTGMALDILSMEYPKGSVFSQSKEYAWLKQNCWDYGFIPRYPEDKTDKTKISFEPWHFRYIGKPLSLYAKQTNFCFEEMVESLQQNKFMEFETQNEGNYIFLLIKNGQGFAVENGLTVEYSLMKLTDKDDLIVIKK